MKNHFNAALSFRQARINSRDAVSENISLWEDSITAKLQFIGCYLKYRVLPFISADMARSLNFLGRRLAAAVASELYPSVSVLRKQ